MGGLIGINSLSKGFNYKYFTLAINEQDIVGSVSGLMSIRNINQNANPSIYSVDDYHNSFTLIAGPSLKTIGLSASFSSSDSYGAVLSITNIGDIAARVLVAFQQLF